MSSGVIFDIQRFSVHDGPGIRTTVFFKGCPLRCRWCHNPESFLPSVQLMLFPERCIKCYRCVEACPNGAVTLVGGEVRQNWEACRSSGACVMACAAQARVLTGREVTAEEVVSEALKDEPFYATSGGGITLSGGEVLLQAPFALEVLKLSQRHGLHTVLDTAGQGPWPPLEALLPYVDLVLYDIKCMDRERHRDLTGVPNDLILANAPRVAARVPLIVRVPVVPGCTDDEANIAAIARFAASLPGRPRVELLPYHRLAESKYPRLGYSYTLPGLTPPSAEQMARLREIVSEGTGRHAAASGAEATSKTAPGQATGH